MGFYGFFMGFLRVAYGLGETWFSSVHQKFMGFYGFFWVFTGDLWVFTGTKNHNLLFPLKLSLRSAMEADKTWNLEALIPENMTQET